LPIDSPAETHGFRNTASPDIRGSHAALFETLKNEYAFSHRKIIFSSGASAHPRRFFPAMPPIPHRLLPVR